MNSSRSIINKYCFLVATASTASGVPVYGAVIDVASLVSLWVGMVCELLDYYGYKYDFETVKKAVNASLAGCIGGLIRNKAYANFLTWFPGVGTLGSIGLNASANVCATYSFGKFCDQQFSDSSFDMLHVAASLSLFSPMLPGSSELIYVTKDSGEIIELVTGLFKLFKGTPLPTI